MPRNATLQDAIALLTVHRKAMSGDEASAVLCGVMWGELEHDSTCMALQQIADAWLCVLAEIRGQDPDDFLAEFAAGFALTRESTDGN
jgi:hypothetical protein